MQKATKIALAAAGLIVAGAAGLSGLAIADYRGSHGKEFRMAHYNSSGWHGKRGKRGHKMVRMMERFDTNEDGRLTQTEFDDARKALLTKHDTNGDGKLTLQEFEPLWMEFARERMVRRFQRIDRDGDAVITTDEYMKPFSRIVQRLDRNDDGALDFQDRKHRWRHHWRGQQHDHAKPPSEN